jgi:selenium metabolism protein YedF
MKEIDARGLACPAPVLQTKDAVENEGVTVVDVVVDNSAAQQNVQRFLESKGFATTLEQQGDDFRVKAQLKTAAAAGPAPTPAAATEQKKIVVLCATDRLGFGDDELGQKLMVSFIKTVKEMGAELWHLIFVNNGVKLTIGGSPVLEDLQGYEKEGLKILVCGTCLDHFKLLEKKQVGDTTNMLDIVTAMQLADKVITL